MEGRTRGKRRGGGNDVASNARRWGIGFETNDARASSLGEDDAAASGGKGKPKTKKKGKYLNFLVSMGILRKRMKTTF